MCHFTVLSHLLEVIVVLLKNVLSVTVSVKQPVCLPDAGHSRALWSPCPPKSLESYAD